MKDEHKTKKQLIDEIIILRQKAYEYKILNRSVKSELQKFSDGKIHRTKEKHLQRINRNLRMVSEFNKKLIRTSDETELICSVCDIVISIGGYRMVWVGFKEYDKRKSVRLIVHKGFEDEYLNSVDISWSKTKIGREPTGTAIRTGKPVVVQNIKTNSNFIPWRKEAVKRGYGSSITLPFNSEGETFGAFSIYAEKIEAFDKNEISILTELTNDLVYGIRVLRTREKHLQAEEKLRISEERYRQLVKLLPDAVIVHCEGRIVLINDTGLKNIGVKNSDKIIGYPVLEFVHPDYRDIAIRRIQKALKSGETTPLIHEKFIRLDKKVIDVEVIATPINYQNKPAMLTVVHDITKRMQAEKALKESEERLDLAVKGTGIGLWDWMIQTGEMVHNERWAQIIGYTLDEISPVSFETMEKFCHPNDLKKSNKFLEKHFAGETEYYECELRMKHKNGKWIWVLDKGKIVEWDDEGNPIRMSGTHLDITKRKLAEFQIKKDLQEKEVMLKEIHHRVKNNLNLIKSLLNLQAQTIKTKKQALDAFKESRDRIFTMALIHERLYKADDFTRISMKPYINDISREITRLYQYEKKVFLEVFVENIYLNINTAIPCGLIVNELITNAIKYAFQDGRKGKISIDLRNLKDNKYQLSVKDNGIGISDELVEKISDSLGIKLVYLLSKQINGELDIIRDKGTQFKIIFPCKSGK